jgi:hypothetical protein
MKKKTHQKAMTKQENQLLAIIIHSQNALEIPLGVKDKCQFTLTPHVNFVHVCLSKSYVS